MCYQSQSLLFIFSIPPGLVVCLIVAFAFWTVRLVKVIHNGFKAWEIRHFFHQVLQIADVSSVIFTIFQFLLTCTNVCSSSLCVVF